MSLSIVKVKVIKKLKFVLIKNETLLNKDCLLIQYIVNLMRNTIGLDNTFKIPVLPLSTDDLSKSKKI